jgi:uncharacterized protein (TIGR02145 family)
VVRVIGFSNNTVTIGNQTWLKENLKVTRYNDGTDIPEVTDNAAWAALSTPAYCWYDNNITNKDLYGAIYSSYAVIGSKELCPTEWHVPTKAEYDVLLNNVGSTRTACYGALIKGGSSGFDALMGGRRGYDGISERTNIWSKTNYSASQQWDLDIYQPNNTAMMYQGFKTMGSYVRCIKN